MGTFADDVVVLRVCCSRLAIKGHGKEFVCRSVSERLTSGANQSEHQAAGGRGRGYYALGTEGGSLWVLVALTSWLKMPGEQVPTGPVPEPSSCDPRLLGLAPELHIVTVIVFE